MDPIGQIVLYLVTTLVIPLYTSKKQEDILTLSSREAEADLG